MKFRPVLSLLVSTSSASSFIISLSSPNTILIAGAKRPGPRPISSSFRLLAEYSTPLRCQSNCVHTTMTTRRRHLHSHPGDAEGASPSRRPRSKKQRQADEPESSTSGSTNNDTSHDQAPWFTVFTKNDEQYFQYMSTEWGVEKRGDRALFEKLSLEGAQSGLSWLTILRKREAYRRTFKIFDIDAVASMTDDDVNDIVSQDNGGRDPSDIVVRHRGKIQAVINNARCIQKMRLDASKEQSNSKSPQEYPHGVFDHFLWSFVNDQPIVNTSWDGKNLTDLPSKTEESEAMSKALKKHGFKFVGPTTCYSMMNSVGMAIDHPVDSPEWKAAIERLKKRKGGYQMR